MNIDRNTISERDVDGFLQSHGVPKQKWYQRDISRVLTTGIVVFIFAITAILGYFRGAYGIWASFVYFAGIFGLLSIYLTYTWQWPRLLRYLRQLWRRSY